MPRMFETAELGRSVGKEEFEAEVPKLRLELLEAQRELQKAGVPVIVLLAGADGAGKGETVSRVLEWLDTRGLDTHAFGPPTDEERERPRWWRYWMRLPPRGRIGIFFGSWYSEPLVERAFGRLSRARYDRMLGEIAFFEQMLAEDGALVVKLWIHLSKKGLRKRLRRLEDDPATRWKVTKADWKHFKKYDRYIEASEHAIRRTDTSHAPWLLVEATDERYRDLMAGRTLLERFRSRLAEAPPATGRRPRGQPRPAPGDEQGGLAHHPRPGGPEAEARPGRVRPAAREGAGAARPPRARRLREEAVVGGRLRGLGRLRQGRQHPPDHRGHGPAHLPRHLGRRAHGRGEGPPLPLAVLAPRPARRLRHRLRPLVVRPGAGRARRGLRPARGVEPRLPRDQRLRAAARRPRHRAREVLAPRRREGAAPPLPRAGDGGLEAAQDRPRGLAQPREVGRLRGGGLRHDRAHEHRAGARGRSWPRTTSASPGCRSSSRSARAAGEGARRRGDEPHLPVVVRLLPPQPDAAARPEAGPGPPARSCGPACWSWSPAAGWGSSRSTSREWSVPRAAWSRSTCRRRCWRACAGAPLGPGSKAGSTSGWPGPTASASATSAGRVDLVLAFYVVHEIREPAVFFAEVAAALKPDGAVLVVEPPLHVSRAAFEASLAVADGSGPARGEPTADRPQQGGPAREVGGLTAVTPGGGLAAVSGSSRSASGRCRPSPPSGRGSSGRRGRRPRAVAEQLEHLERAQDLIATARRVEPVQHRAADAAAVRVVDAAGDDVEGHSPGLGRTRRPSARAPRRTARRRAVSLRCRA